MVWEFWKTLRIEKSEIMYEYINKKNDIKEEINKPLTQIYKYLLFLFFLVIINWKVQKNKDNQSERFPKNGAINWIYITTFLVD